MKCISWSAGNYSAADLHVKVGFPFIINPAGKILDECYVRRLSRSVQNFHLCFFRRPVSFFVVALDACSREIFPAVLSSSRLWNHMVNCQIGCSSAILASVSVSSQNILPGKNYLLKWHLYKENQPDNTWIVKCPADCRDFLLCNAIYGFRFAKVYQNYCPPDIADCQRFIILVQNENFPVQITVSA